MTSLTVSQNETIVSFDTIIARNRSDVNSLIGFCAEEGAEGATKTGCFIAARTVKSQRRRFLTVYD
jgi:hypothetical protein